MAAARSQALTKTHLDVNVTGDRQARVVKGAEEHVDAHALGLELDHLQSHSVGDRRIQWKLGRIVYTLRSLYTQVKGGTKKMEREGFRVP